MTEQQITIRIETRHPQVWLFPFLEGEEPWGPRVDEGIRDLLLEFVIRGVSTLFSCEGEPSGRAYIMFQDADKWAEFVEFIQGLESQFDDEQKAILEILTNLPSVSQVPTVSEIREHFPEDSDNRLPDWYGVRYDKATPVMIQHEDGPSMAQRFILRLPPEAIGTLTAMIRVSEGGVSAEEIFLRQLSASEANR